MNKKLHPQTLAIRGGKEQTEYREHNQALFLTSSFMWESAQHAADLFSKKIKGFTYTRTANPTTAAFEKRIAALEGAERAVATSTGMSAIQAAFFYLLASRRPRCFQPQPVRHDRRFHQQHRYQVRHRSQPCIAG